MQQCSNDQIQKIIDLIKVVKKGFREAASEEFKKYGFTFPQFTLMFTLYQTPNLMLSELSEKMELSKSTVSELVERMEKQGIVIRQVPKDNRRTVRLSLSPEFIKNNRDILDFRNKFFRELFNLKNVSVEDASVIILGLEKLADLLPHGQKE